MVTKKKVNKEEKPEQLSLGLKSPFKNFFFDIKSRIVNRFNLFEANTFINSPYVWFMATIQLVGSFYQLIYLLNNINRLPSIIPFIGYSNVSALTLVPKLYFLSLPLASLLLFILTFKWARTTYFKHQSISEYTLFIGSLLVITISLYLLKVISQYV